MQPESAARPFSELEPDPLPEARGPGECLLSYPNVNADIVIPAKERHPRERTSPPRKNVTPAKERHPRESGRRESEYPSSFPRKRESICCREASCCRFIERSITWIPAFAGMTNPEAHAFAGMTNPDVPAFAGMTDLEVPAFTDTPKGTLPPLTRYNIDISYDISNYIFGRSWSCQDSIAAAAGCGEECGKETGALMAPSSGAPARGA